MTEADLVRIEKLMIDRDFQSIGSDIARRLAVYAAIADEVPGLVKEVRALMQAERDLVSRATVEGAEALKRVLKRVVRELEAGKTE